MGLWPEACCMLCFAHRQERANGREPKNISTSPAGVQSNKRPVRHHKEAILGNYKLRSLAIRCHRLGRLPCSAVATIFLCLGDCDDCRWGGCNRATDLLSN